MADTPDRPISLSFSRRVLRQTVALSVVLIGNVHQGPMRIALVDPNPAINSLAACALDARGHEVLWFADGAQALQAIRADPLVDTLITDSDTRPLSGVELCWEARLL